MARYTYSTHDYSDSEPFGLGGGGNGNPPGHGYSPGHNVTGSWIHIFGASGTNNVQFSWFQEDHHRQNPGAPEYSENDLGIFDLPMGNLKLGAPVVNFTNFSSLGQDAQQLKYRFSKSLTDNATLIRGRHTLKFGGEWRKVKQDVNQPSGNTDWRFSSTFTNQVGFGSTGFDFASFMLGLPINLSYQYNPDYFRPRTSSFALYVQDDIRVNWRLTVNLGMRWDAPLWFSEAFDRAGLFNINLNQWQKFNTPGLPRRTAWLNNYSNWGPRAGFAYSPFGANKTVIRGGFGMFQLGINLNSVLDRGPFFGDTSQGRYNTTDNLTWKTTLDYNVGRHLPGGDYNMNAIPLSDSAVARGRFIAPYVPFPQFPGGVTMRTWIGKQSYNSLQVKVEKRFGSGLGFLANYTWAKTIASQDGTYRDPAENRNLDRGLGPYSIPQRLNLAFSYELPFGKGKKWVTGGPLVYPLGGWVANVTPTFQSGFPLTPVEGYNSAVNGSGTSRPNALVDPALPPSQRTVQRWFNVSAFAIPALYTTGNAGRGLIYGPGKQSVNVNLAKRFYGFGNEKRYAELRAEAYDLLNTSTFADPNVTVDSLSAGTIGTSRNKRQIQFALKFYF